MLRLQLSLGLLINLELTAPFLVRVARSDVNKLVETRRVVLQAALSMQTTKVLHLTTTSTHTTVPRTVLLERASVATRFLLLVTLLTSMSLLEPTIFVDLAPA